MKSKETNILGTEKVHKLLIKLSTPAIIAMLINAVYNLVDTFFVGLLNDNAAMGAVSIAFPIFMVVVALGQAMGVGSGALVSQLLGAGNTVKAKKVAVTSIITSLFIGLTITTIGLLFLDQILAFTGVTGDLLAKSREYLKYVILAATFTILNMNLNNLVRSEGKAIFSMIAIILGALVNVILDPILIFTLDMGVTGASLATAIAQGVSTLFLFGFYLTGKSSLGLNLRLFSPKWYLYSKILKIGTPTFSRQFLASLALALVNIAVIPFGDSAVASIGIVLRIVSIGIFILFGISQGFQPIAAFNFGAGNIIRVRQALKYANIMNTVFSLVSTSLFLIFATSVIGIFSNDAEVIKLGSRSLRIIMLLFIGNAFQILITTLFQSLGKARESFILAISRQGLFFIPSILILPKFFGFYGVALSFLVADGLSFILTFVFFKRLQREFKSEISKTKEVLRTA